MFGFTIIRESELNNLQGELKTAKQTISNNEIQISFLKTMKDELYNKLHNKPKDSKGRFCKKVQSN